MAEPGEKLSQLDEALASTDDDLVYVVSGGVSKKMKHVTLIATAMLAVETLQNTFYASRIVSTPAPSGIPLDGQEWITVDA